LVHSASNLLAGWAVEIVVRPDLAGLLAGRHFINYKLNYYQP
jgi:hypothetical protein